MNVLLYSSMISSLCLTSMDQSYNYTMLIDLGFQAYWVATFEDMSTLPRWASFHLVLKICCCSFCLHDLYFVSALTLTKFMISLKKKNLITTINDIDLCS